MIDEKILQKSLSDGLIGQNVIYLKTVGSTNEHAFGLAARGAPEGTVVLADEQRKGRGRLQRVWQSPPGRNIYTSVVLRPPFKAAVAPRITLMAGVAVADCLGEYVTEGVSLKWPNDVLIGGRKVCGILTEMKAIGDQVDFVIVGIGLNVNMRREEFDREIRSRATSVLEETGAAASRQDLAVRLYRSLEKWYKTLLEGGFPPVRERWLACAGIQGKKIRTGPGEDAQHGEVLGVDEDGALLIADDHGRRQRVITGDIVIERD
jgi:BirA family biotin operon repressor/biotin-[acetyl-CoA-carboxylase] ligase